MHLLFISSMLPEDEPRSGFAIANQSIADEYRRQGVRLSFAGFRRPGSRVPRAGEVSLGDLVPENAAAGPLCKAKWLVRAMALDLPVSAAKLATMDEEALRRALDAAGPVDGYVLSSVQMPTAYPFLPLAKPSIFVAHNVEHRSAAENAAKASGSLSRRLYRREAELLQRAEERVCREARIVHTLSADDLTGLGLSGRPSAAVLPLAIGRPASGDDGRRTHDVGLIGTWSWAPNRAGLDWFIREVVPLLPSETSIAVAGVFDGKPPVAPRNVRFLGRVPDAQGFVRASRVIALASKGGTGVQLKTIETFEEGMPAVATRAALRGIAELPSNVVVADEAPAFAAALVDVVAGVREGRVGRTSGLAFALAQRHALSKTVEDALAALALLVEPRRQPPRRRLQADAQPAFEPATAVGA